MNLKIDWAGILRNFCNMKISLRAYAKHYETKIRFRSNQNVIFAVVDLLTMLRNKKSGSKYTARQAALQLRKQSNTATPCAASEDVIWQKIGGRCKDLKHETSCVKIENMLFDSNTLLAANFRGSLLLDDSDELWKWCAIIFWKGKILLSARSKRVWKKARRENMRCNAQKLYTNPEVTPDLHSQEESDTHTTQSFRKHSFASARRRKSTT